MGWCTRTLQLRDIHVRLVLRQILLALLPGRQEPGPPCPLLDQPLALLAVRDRGFKVVVEAQDVPVDRGVEEVILAIERELVGRGGGDGLGGLGHAVGVQTDTSVAFAFFNVSRMYVYITPQWGHNSFSQLLSTRPISAPAPPCSF